MAPKKIQTIAKISMKLIVFLIIFKTAALFLSDSILMEEKISIRGAWLTGFILCFLFAICATESLERFKMHAMILGLFLITFGQNIMFIASYKNGEQITNDFLGWTMICIIASLMCLYHFFPILYWLKLKSRDASKEKFA
jgi:hypothetical protein